MIEHFIFLDSAFQAGSRAWRRCRRAEVSSQDLDAASSGSRYPYLELRSLAGAFGA